MTEILTLQPRPIEERPTIVRAIQFVPWPFEDEEVGLDTTWLIAADGTLDDTGFDVSLYGGDDADDNVLVVLSDGRFAASSEQGVRAYGRPSPP